MGELYDNIMKLCAEKGIKAGRMCNELGISRSFMSDLKYNRKESASQETLIRLSEYFNVPIERIIGKKENAPEEGVAELLTGLRYEARALLEVLPQMTEEQVKQMTDFAKFLRSQDGRNG